MLVIQTSWWFLVFVIGGIFSHKLDPECHKLVQNFDGVATPNRPICILVRSFANVLHVNVTKNTTPGVLYVENSVCNNGLLVNMNFKIENGEYVDFKVYLPCFTVNKNCNLDKDGNMRMVFKSYSEPIKFAVKNMLTPHLESKMVDDYEYENEKTKTSKDLRAEFRTPKGKLEMIVQRKPASDVTEEHAELGRYTNIEFITWITVGLLFAISMCCFLKFFGYYFSFLGDNGRGQSNIFVGYDESDIFEDSENNEDDSDDTENFDTSAHSENSDDYEDHTKDAKPYYMDTLDDSGCHVLRLYDL